MAVMWATLDEFDERPSYVYYGKGSELNMRAVAAAELLGYGNSDGSLGRYCIHSAAGYPPWRKTECLERLATH